VNEPCERKHKPMQILIVEDEPLVSLQLQMDLEEMGHQCRTSGDVASSRSLIEDEKFDVALLDFNLGGESSTAIADLLLKKEIPFAWTTGYTDTDLLPERLRGRPRLFKPFSIEDVGKVLRSLVAAEAPSTSKSKRPRCLQDGVDIAKQT
jgi:DNA-binding NtrC family response regulator